MANDWSCPAIARAEVEATGHKDLKGGQVEQRRIGRDIAFLDTPADLFQKIVSVNLTGTFLVGQAAAREMKRTGGGRIINITSVSGRRGNVGRAAYGASKAGVVNLTQVMAIELAPHGILVNAIAPGPIETPLVAQMHTPEARRRWTARTALRRYGTPQEIAGAALFLASDDASYITGHVLDADGGFLAAGMLGEPD